MTTPIKNDQTGAPPPTDPYGGGDIYGDYGSGYDPNMGSDTGNDLGFDDNIYTDTGGQPGDPGQGSGVAPLTVDGLRSQLNDEQTQLNALKTSNPDLWNKIHADVQKKIDAVRGEINFAVAKSGDAQTAALSKAEGELGTLDGMIQGTASAGGSTGDPNVDLKKSLQDYKTSINSNSNLSSADKTSYCAQIDKWIQGLDSKLLTADSVQPLFEKMQSDMATVAAYPAAYKSLGEVTGKSPDELDAIFKKHGIDPNNLPTPPDSKIAALLNDPDFSSDLAADTKKVGDDYKAYSDAITKSSTDANAMNTANQADTSKFNPDVTSFQHLQGLYDHSSDECKNMIGDRKKLATDTANVLSALYGKTVTASADDAKAGTVTFDGTEINVCTSSQQGVVAFGTTTAVDWETTDFRVQYKTDCEGDGASGYPSWMDGAGYPKMSYDGDLQQNASG